MLVLMTLIEFFWKGSTLFSLCVGVHAPPSHPSLSLSCSCSLSLSLSHTHTHTHTCTHAHRGMLTHMSRFRMTCSVDHDDYLWNSCMGIIISNRLCDFFQFQMSTTASPLATSQKSSVYLSIAGDVTGSITRLSSDSAMSPELRLFGTRKRSGSSSASSHPDMTFAVDWVLKTNYPSILFHPD